MKIRVIPSPSLVKATLLGAVLALAAGLNHASAAVLSFSGGSGAPLSLSLSSPVTYTLTGVPAGGYPPFFVFQGVGNIFPNFTNFTGTITYSVNGGAAQVLNQGHSNFTQNNTAATDLYFFGPFVPTLAIGDVLTLTSGTLTSFGNFAGAVPVNGTYSSFIANGFGVNIGSEGRGAGVPDAGVTVAMFGISLLGLMGLRRRVA